MNRATRLKELGLCIRYQNGSVKVTSQQYEKNEDYKQPLKTN